MTLNVDNRFVTPEFITLKDEMAAIGKRMQETAQEYFKVAAKKIFEEVPALEEIRWLQYTPYFNDGDSCVFSVNDINFISKADVEAVGGDIDALEDIDWGYNSFDEDKYHKERYDANVLAYGEEAMKRYYAAVEDFEDFIHSIDDEILLTMFGDHVMVRVTPDEIIIDDYEHD